jgi:metal-dependent amidase/aminoacylase/carboxypeptidase family protein
VTVTALETAAPPDEDIARAARFRVEAAFVAFDADTSVILAAAQAVVALGLHSRDEQTTIRVETIRGGHAPGEPPGRCLLVADVASSSDERAETAIADVIDCLHDAANRPECSSDLDITVQRASTDHATAALPAHAR